MKNTIALMDCIHYLNEFVGDVPNYKKSNVFVKVEDVNAPINGIMLDGNDVVFILNDY